MYDSIIQITYFSDDFYIIFKTPKRIGNGNWKLIHLDTALPMSFNTTATILGML